MWRDRHRRSLPAWLADKLTPAEASSRAAPRPRCQVDWEDAVLRPSVVDAARYAWRGGVSELRTVRPGVESRVGMTSAGFIYTGLRPRSCHARRVECLAVGLDPSRGHLCSRRSTGRGQRLAAAFQALSMMSKKSCAAKSSILCRSIIRSWNARPSRRFCRWRRSVGSL